MGTKKKLPVLPPDSTSTEKPGTRRNDVKLTLEKARARLGGALDGAPAHATFTSGKLVDLTEGSRQASRQTGVVLVSTVEEVVVLLDAACLRRVPPSLVVESTKEPSAVLSKLAVDAKIFGGLVEGQMVRFARDKSRDESEIKDPMDAHTDFEKGKLISKCRYGGLVALANGTVLAVGFRKLWPVTSTETIE